MHIKKSIFLQFPLPKSTTIFYDFSYPSDTKRIIEQLENGIIPWQRPWTGTKSGAYNRVTGKPYSLLNQMLLHHSGEYASFKQWTEAGGHIRKGEKSEIVTFWKLQPIKEKQEDGTEIIKQIPFLRYYNVCKGFAARTSSSISGIANSAAAKV